MFVTVTPVASDAIDWARRVNRRWIVRRELAATAERWLDELAARRDPRLATACRNARAFVALRSHQEDPKPWFYAGLFSLATAEEARRFLRPHRLTSAAIPSTADDPAITAWLASVGPETRDLVRRLRAAACSVA